MLLGLCPPSFSLVVSFCCFALFDLCIQASYQAITFVLCLFFGVIWLGLSWGTNDQSLKEAFSSFGEVTEGQYLLNVLLCH
jgi:hypothetical protein